MKIIFFGTPDYVLPILTNLHKKFVTGPGISPIVAVVTQSPKPTDRKRIILYTPVDKWAHEREIPTFYKAGELLKEDIVADLGICAAYGEIIPKTVINSFKFGILNVHPSLLPKFRGASPISAAIMAGDTQTGVSIIKMDEKVDHGPIITQFKEDISPNDTSETLRARLFERSVDVLIELLEPYMKGRIRPKAQNDKEATFTKILTKQNGFIDMAKTPAEEAERFIRAMLPWPGAWTHIRLPSGGQARRIKLLKSHVVNGKLVLDEVQLEGKTPVSWRQFLMAYPESEFTGNNTG